VKRVRIIPTLLVDQCRLVKTTAFTRPKYIGDPINSVKIFNDKQVDELVVLDISASPAGRAPNLDLIKDLASECFMPLAYGGGITSVDQAQAIFKAGVEKIILNTAFFSRPEIVGEVARIYGSQAVVVSIDARRRWPLRKPVAVYRSASRSSGLSPADAARRAVEAGAGELYVNAVDRDGTMLGYDIELIRAVSTAVDVPVIAAGGASRVDDFLAAVRDGGASAASAGAMFVFNGPHRAVLISYPNQATLRSQIFEQL
jgi:imidazole glycerol-phosphate synthase subunit HisF